MRLGILEESHPGEARVTVVPKAIGGLTEAGWEVSVETAAGLAAGFADSEYEAAGARTGCSHEEVLTGGGVLLVLHPPQAADLGCIAAGTTLVGMLDPLGSPEGCRRLASAGVDALALELLPRVTRAQSMDVLTSMATISGYRAALLAATTLPRLYPMLITAAGTVAPARVFVVGAGVAGLQAIATSHRLGALVQAYDLRPVVKEEVESVGARFLGLEIDTAASEDSDGYARAMGEEFYRRQREMMGAAVARSDVVITTAAVPGRRAPVLITAEMVKAMRCGAVIVDLAAESGGNCELSQPGSTTVVGGVSILAPLNVPSGAAYDASRMLSRNFTAFLAALVIDGEIDLERDDEILESTLVVRGGRVVDDRVRELLEPREKGES